MLSGWMSDLGYALRQLRRSPGFALIALGVLGLGIGANSALFSLIDAVALRGLPFGDAQRMVILGASNPSHGIAMSSVGYPSLSDWQEGSGALQDTAYWSGRSLNLTSPGDPERVAATAVSPNFFSFLGLKAAPGRLPLPQDDEASASGIVLGRSFWQRRFSSDPGIVGQALTLDGRSYTVLGVLNPPRGLAPALTELRQSDVFVPFQPDELTARGRRFLKAYGKLAPGVDIDQARRELNAVALRLEEEYPSTNQGWRVSLSSLNPLEDPEQALILVILQAVVGCILLIACANVSGLLLARSLARRREAAVRAALGAGRLRLLRQSLTESLLLSTLGALLGLALAAGLYQLLQSVLVLPAGADIEVFNWRVIAYSLVLVALSSLAFGLLPAWFSSRFDLSRSLHGSGRQAGGGRRLRLGGGLVALEVATAMILLTASGLFMSSFLKARNFHPGFDVDPLLTLRLELDPERYSSLQQRLQFQNRLQEELQALPGVESAALADNLPLAGTRNMSYFRKEGEAPPQPGQERLTLLTSVTPGYWSSTGIELLEGRDFTRADGGDSQPAAIVNQTLAELLWPDRSALGQRLLMDGSQAYQVVGVVRDAVFSNLRDASPQAYRPLAQQSAQQLRILVRQAGAGQDPESLAEPVRQALWRIDPLQPVYQVRGMSGLFADSIGEERVAAALMGLVALLALALASLGLFGLVSFWVTQRVHEIGVRMALGARRKGIFRLVLGQGLRFVLAGAVAGLAAGLGLAHLMESLLFGVSPGDPLTHLATLSLLTLVALAAMLAPALRATRVDPINALRAE